MNQNTRSTTPAFSADPFYSDYITVRFDDLIAWAQSARASAIRCGCKGEELDAHSAQSFFAMLAGYVSSRRGLAAHDEFVKAIGFDYLCNMGYPENIGSTPPTTSEADAKTSAPKPGAVTIFYCALCAARPVHVKGTFCAFCKEEISSKINCEGCES